LLRDEFIAAVNVARPVEVGLPAPLNLAFGAAYRREWYKIRPGETASWINGFHLDQDSAAIAPSGSSGFPGFTPDNATERDRNNFGLYADAETDLTPKLLANLSGRFESYNDFGERLTGKLAVRFQPSRRLILRGAAGTGFRAPGLSQVAFNKVITNVIEDQFVEVGVFPVDHPAALAHVPYRRKPRST
jgi:iron complex outermembrane receptor protein